MNRSLHMGIALFAAYLIMRAWPSHHSWLSTLLASLLTGLLGYRHLATRSRGQQYGWGALAIVSSVSCYLLLAPAQFDNLSNLCMTWREKENLAWKAWQENSASQAPMRAGNWLWNEHQLRPIPQRAHLKPGNKPEVFLQMDDVKEAHHLMSQRAYLRAFALARYDKAAWSASGETPRSPSLFQQRKGRMISYEVFHPSDPSGQTPVIALQGMIDVSTHSSPTADEVLLLPPQQQASGYRYRARSQPMQLDDLAEADCTTTPTDAPKSWLLLPSNPTLRDGLSKLLSTHATGGTLKNRLLRLRTALQQQFDYSLSYQNSGNHDPLINFLFFERKGHCELFATAAAMAARQMGVPARIAYGWTGGSYYETSRLLVFRAHEAHAWAELWFDEVGWVIFDATPPRAMGRSRIASPEETPLSSEEMTTPSHDRSLLMEQSHWMTWSLLVISISSISLVAWKHRRAQSGQNSLFGEQKHSSLLPQYEVELMSWHRDQGVIPQPYWTLRERFASLHQPPRCAEKLCCYHYATQYGKKYRDFALEKQWAEELRAERQEQPRKN